MILMMISHSDRRIVRLARDEYVLRAVELAPRGELLPQAKLTREQVLDIKSAVIQRDGLKTYIKDNLTNKALAKRFGVHRRTIEKIVSNETWIHER